MKTKSGFFGVYPMVYALFDKKGNLVRKSTRRQVAAMLKHKAHGVAVLGLATEVNKLSTSERRMLMEWVAEDLNGKAPLAVTVAENSVAGQIDFVRASAAAGAGWVILQPPQVEHLPESELIRFFGAVADASPIPHRDPECAGISRDRLVRRRHPHAASQSSELQDREAGGDRDHRRPPARGNPRRGRHLQRPRRDRDADSIAAALSAASRRRSLRRAGPGL